MGFARKFNGTSDQGKISKALVKATPFTFAVWFNMASLATFGGLITVGVTNSEVFELLADNTTSQVGCFISAAGVSNQIDTTTTFALNKWNHACGVFASPTSRSAYLNGGGKNTGVTSRTPGSMSQTLIGTDSAVSPSWFNGLLAEVAIWDVALTDAEVAMLGKHRVLPTQIRPSDLIYYNRDLIAPAQVGTPQMVWTGTKVANGPTLVDVRPPLVGTYSSVALRRRLQLAKKIIRPTFQNMAA